MSIRPRAKTETVMSQDKAYDTILRPIVTEKSTMLAEQNKIGFVVPMSATKPEIKAAVELLYKVNVEAVNTSVLKGKTKRFRGVLGRRIDQKKAIVTLADGQSIDLMQGV
ncbi:MAG: 50S ribosomal protein L23 [Alphaproteobacteria bacterium]|jgi:large subunit ribosomal protein L23|nr:50S ribosomal protein L23 [Alphaproteobacteria bacterium]